MSIKVVAWLLLGAGIAGAGWWIRGVLAERDALRVQVASMTKNAQEQADALKEERDEAQARVDRAVAEMAKYLAKPREVSVVRTRLVRAPASVCRPVERAGEAAGQDQDPAGAPGATSGGAGPAGATCFRDSDWTRFRDAIDQRIAQWRALSGSVQALPCVEVTD